MRRLALLSCLVLSLSLAGIAGAQIPDPDSSSAPVVLYSPWGNHAYFVDVADNLGSPVVGSLVEIEFTPEAAAEVMWCPGSAPPFSAITDSTGRATFYIAAGGCIHPDSLLSPPGVEIFADGVSLGLVGGLSPDITGDGEVGAPDYAVFAPACSGLAPYVSCADYNQDGVLDLLDSQVWATPVIDYATCDTSFGTGPTLYPYELPATNAAASLALHVAPATGSFCDPVGLALTNASIQTSDVSGAGYNIYFVVCDVDTLAGVQGAEFGVMYDDILLYVDDSNGSCDPFFGGCRNQYSLAPGIGISFQTTYHPSACRTNQGNPADPDSTLRVIGSFYVYAYAPTEFEIVPHPVSGEVRILDCGGNYVDIAGQTPSRLGKLGFDLPGYNPSNLAPVAVPDTASTPNDTGLTIPVLANDYDPNADPIHVASLNTTPTLGSAVITPAQDGVIYTPPPGYVGTDQLLYVVSDDMGASSAGLILINVTASSSVPDPDSSSAPVVIYSPWGNHGYTVLVRDTAGQPIDGSLVEITFSPEAESLVFWCGGTGPPFSAFTDTQGRATFHIAAGGCVNPDSLLSPPGVEVFADGVSLAVGGSLSPDVNGDGQVDAIGDLLRLALPCTQGEAPEYCVDYTQDGVADILDSQVWQTPFWMDANCGSPPGVPLYPQDLPGDNSGASLAFHIANSSKICTPTGGLGLAAHDFVIEGDTQTDYQVYLVACNLDPGVGLQGAEFGLAYDDQLLFASFVTPVDVNEECNPFGLLCQTEPPVYPGIGLAITTTYLPSDCLTNAHSTDDSMRLLGFMDVYAYAATTLEIAPHPISGEVRLLDCGGDLIDIAGVTPSRLGKAGFGLPGFNPVNIAPVAVPDSATVREDSVATVFVLINDTDAEGDSLLVDSLDLSATTGSAVIAPLQDAVIYTPAIVGTDSLVYRVTDFHGGVDSATVVITVTPAPADSFPCDDAGSDTWTFGHTNSSTSSNWTADYTTSEFWSPIRGLYTSVRGGSMGGQDYDHVYAIHRIDYASLGPPDSLTVWFNVKEMVHDSRYSMYSYCRVSAWTAADSLLDAEVYCVAADDNQASYETRSWTYQETRPAEFEPGAPYYERDPVENSIRPPAGWWYKLTALPGTDLAVDWGQVATLEVELRTGGGWMNADKNSMYWDDLCLNGASVGPATVTVLGPNGGETLPGAALHDITWTAVSASGVDSVGIEYSPDNGAAWLPVASGEPNDGVYAWMVPSSPTDSALVRVSAYRADVLVGSDLSDALFLIGLPVGVPDPGVTPPRFALEQNRPNPFRAGTRISFTVPGEQHVRLQVFSVGGRLVRTLVSSVHTPGVHTYGWDARNESGRMVTPGIYLFRLESEGIAVSRKALVLQ